jgi:hypothetical protein
VVRYQRDADLHPVGEDPCLFLEGAVRCLFLGDGGLCRYLGDADLRRVGEGLFLLHLQDEDLGDDSWRSNGVVAAWAISDLCGDSAAWPLNNNRYFPAWGAGSKTMCMSCTR